MLSCMAIPVWLIILLSAIGNSGALRLPLVCALILFLGVGFYANFKDRKRQQSQTVDTITTGICYWLEIYHKSLSTMGL